MEKENDFGFTAVSETEYTPTKHVEAPTKIPVQIEEAISDLNAKLDTLLARTEPNHEMADRLKKVEEAIMPLLNNLLKDADKSELIKWPNRGPIIKAQIDKILALTRV